MADKKWFTDARFGMFIHFGLYSVAAKGEWYASIGQVPPEKYREYFETFDPVHYDPAYYAHIARQAGMKYAVLTAKHHEGFCLFDSAYTDYKSVNTPIGRDLVREFTDAFRAEGIKVGLYYSLVDWHHPDYPAYKDPFHPLRGSSAALHESCDFDRYLDYMHAQVRELCTNYGKIDLLWFDFSYEGHSGPDWRAQELTKMVKSLQPDILINSRLEASGRCLGSLLTDAPTPWAGDFAVPEQIIPPAPLKTPSNVPVCWEACQTLNNSFGYTADDHVYKDSRICIQQLVNCVSKGGNYLLNIGPDANGSLPLQAENILQEMGQWMKYNGESIYGCRESPLPVSAFGCRVTARDHILYLHIMQQPVGPLPLSGIRPKDIRYARMLSTGAEVEVLTKGWAVENYPDYTFISLASQANETQLLPDSADTVIKLVLHRPVSSL
ncbi:hypothetical protein IMSAGC009_03752 [Lachnospiraceae bacterium]|nr:hypothetical protein IMSAGC009_03752 [Lachnospiraceae bacterium]